MCAPAVQAFAVVVANSRGQGVGRAHCGRCAMLPGCCRNPNNLGAPNLQLLPYGRAACLLPATCRPCRTAGLPACFRQPPAMFQSSIQHSFTLHSQEGGHWPDATRYHVKATRTSPQLHALRYSRLLTLYRGFSCFHPNHQDHAGREISRASLPDTASADPTALAATLLGGGNADNVILAIINFSTVHEAAARAALLLAYTWDVRRRRGCTLVPLHATAQARGMALQAAGDAAVAAYGTKPPTAGSMTAADSSIFGGGGGGSRGLSPAMTPAAGSPPVSPSPFAWRHATRGDRQQQQGGSRGSTPLGTAPGSPARGAPHSPKPQQQQQQQQLSPERSRRTTQAEGSSRTGTPQPHSPRGQQAHSPGPGPHGSPSPTGQRSSGPASPGSSPQRSPQRSPLRSPQGRGAPAPAAAVPHPVPLMRPGKPVRHTAACKAVNKLTRWVVDAAVGCSKRCDHSAPSAPSLTWQLCSLPNEKNMKLVGPPGHHKHHSPDGGPSRILVFMDRHRPNHSVQVLRPREPRPARTGAGPPHPPAPARGAGDVPPPQHRSREHSGGWRPPGRDLIHSPATGGWSSFRWLMHRRELDFYNVATRGLGAS